MFFLGTLKLSPVSNPLLSINWSNFSHYAWCERSVIHWNLIHLLVTLESCLTGKTRYIFGYFSISIKRSFIHLSLNYYGIPNYLELSFECLYNILNLVHCFTSWRTLWMMCMNTTRHTSRLYYNLPSTYPSCQRRHKPFTRLIFSSKLVNERWSTYGFFVSA